MNEPAWRPLVLDPDAAVDRETLQALRRGDRVWREYDTVRQQLEDLARTRHPRWTRAPQDPSALETAVQALTGDRPLDAYGRWVYYPWSGDLVHLLPPDAFQELRLNRNQNKITAADQRQLAGRTIGVVGLSVGNAIATALALEGLGGCLKLADFDRLDLSNMNRVRAGVRDVGLPKTVLCARQIFEMNPYADVQLFHEGLTEAGIDAFIGGDPCLDVIIDECDDIRLKMLLREAARDRGVPVLMETSDRGMLDVERFDLEPQRPLFHGLLGDVCSDDVPADMPSEAKLAFVAPIIGIDTLSTRSAASMLEIGETISTWPQLGSEVQLGGATVCAALRALFLEDTLRSGRRYIDLGELVQSVAGTAPSLAEAATELDPPATAAGSAPAAPAVCDGDAAFMRYLVAHGVLAPSGGNSQPWRFHTDRRTLWLLHDRTRSRCLLDVDGRAAHAALGAVITNVRTAAARSGFATDVDYGPAVSCRHPELQVVAALRFRPEPHVRRSAVAADFPWLRQRMTDRRTYGRQPLRAAQRTALQETAAGLPCHLTLLESADALAEVGELAGSADRLRILGADTHREMMAEVRWTAAESRRSRDGLDLATLELSPGQDAAFRLVRRPDVAAFLRRRDGGAALTRLSADAIGQSSAVGLICATAPGVQGLLQAGEAIQTLWLQATRLSLAWHPMTAMIYMFDPAFEAGFTAGERRALDALRVRFQRLLPTHQGCRQVMLFRLSQGAPHSPQGTQHDRRALRRGVDEVLSIQSSSHIEEKRS